MSGAQLGGGAGSAAGPRGGTTAPEPVNGGSGGAGMTSGVAGSVATGSGGVGATTPPVTGGAGRAAAGSGAAGLGAAGGSAGSSEPSGALSKLAFEYTTKSYNGRYAPKNAGAVWIEDSSGKWIDTLEYWGSTPNDTHLTKYVATKAPDYAMCGALEKLFGSCSGSNVTMPPPDVITAATFTSHKAHAGDKWDFKDSKGAAVPDGDYKIVVEIAEDDLSEKTQEMPFTKGATPGTSMPADTATVTGMKLTLQ